MLHKLNYPMLGLVIQAIVGPLLVLLKLLDAVQWSWAYVIMMPMALTLAAVLLGLFEHLAAHTPYTVEKKRPPRHIL